MSKHVMAVAAYYKLFKDADGYSLDQKQVIEERVLIPRKHIERINSQYKQAGKYYVIDEEATNEAFAKGDETVAAVREAEETAGELASVMADTLKEAKKKGKKKAKKKQDSEDSED